MSSAANDSDQDFQMGLPWDEAPAHEPGGADSVSDRFGYGLTAEAHTKPVPLMASGSDAIRAAFRHPQAQHEIRLGQAVVAYEFKRARRRSIGMVVTVDGLSVRAPKWASWTDIETALRAKERWICTKLLDQRERAQKMAESKID